MMTYLSHQDYNNGKVTMCQNNTFPLRQVRLETTMLVFLKTQLLQVVSVFLSKIRLPTEFTAGSLLKVGCVTFPHQFADIMWPSTDCIKT